MPSRLLPDPLCCLTIVCGAKNTFACCPAVQITAFWASARPLVQHGRSEEGGTMALSNVVFALTIRPFPNWGWELASGLVGILLGLILWASLPVTALWLIGVLLGINLISVGAAIGYLAWQVRQS